MLPNSKNVLFPGHNHLLITGTNDPSLAGARAIIEVRGHQYQWLAGGYDLEIGHFRSDCFLQSVICWELIILSQDHIYSK